MSAKEEEPDGTPRESSVTGPATVDACRTDYRDGADVRAKADKQWADERRGARR
ncbi:hypothetical protein [Streptomyces sp. NPDC051173]|uniref:hypothetical protein n=1 Tax=Streptomyces sp. NPDC051173 TaxID=3155164 RepID=UPI00344B10D5